MNSTVPRTLGIAVGMLLAAALPTSAQRLEFGANVGYFLPTVEQFERSVVRASSTGYAVERYSARQDPGFAFGLALTAWPLTNLGLDLSAALRFGQRSGSSPYCICPDLPMPAGDNVTVSSLVLRPVARAALGATTLRAGAGVALIHLGGSAYDGGTDEISVADRTFGGGNLLIDVTRSVGRLRLRLGLEDLVYRVAMTELPPGSDTRTPLQHDVTMTLGVGVPLR